MHCESHRARENYGYVLIPVVLSDGEDPESIISASSYAKIGEVIDALSQYDQTLDEILREERRDLGRKRTHWRSPRG